MSFGIYKSGQGYWVRVMTATLVGVITLATAVWVYRQAALVADRLPKSSYALTLNPYPATGLSVGSSIELLGAIGSDQVRPSIGSAAIQELRPDDRTVVINQVKATGTLDALSAAAVSVTLPEGGKLPAEVTSRAALEPVQPELLGGIGAAVVILIGAVIGYYFAGVRRPTVDFLIDTDFEMKKVNWSTPREVIGSTWVVVFACFGIALLLFTFDTVFRVVFTWIGVLYGANS
ncbi:MAG: preprotein translocase subunit SecE [Planctomycetaceae bacterium]|jgi:preprotein translocase SecE subunit|nr:preprotein translocase subunit SecE [Phycisphaerales bacterium]MCE2654712.1 preprotein translocase subunit SecE [Planctomycetaceae bacterium]